MKGRMTLLCIADHCGAAFLAAFVVRSIAGSLEMLFQILRGDTPASLAMILPVAVCYALLSVVLGLCGAFAAGTAFGILQVRVARLILRRSYVLILGAAWLYFLVGAYVNWWVFPADSFSVKALSFDILLLVGIVAVLVPTINKMVRSIQSRESRTGRYFSRIGIALFSVFILTSYLSPLVLTALEDDGSRERVSVARAGCSVVYIVADACRADHLSCYGYQRETSPNIDKLAREGALFEKAISQCSWTKPSVASYFTSKYPSTLDLLRPNSALPKSAVTITEMLKDKGYSTAVFSQSFYVSPMFGFDRGVDRFYYPNTALVSTLAVGQVCKVLGRSLPTSHCVSTVLRRIQRTLNRIERTLAIDDTDTTRLDVAGITSQTLDWITTHRDSRFFAYVHYMPPHAPYNPPAPYETLYYDPDRDGVAVTNHPPYNGFQPFDKAEQLPDQELQNMIDHYDAHINYVDDQIGDLVKGLGDLELLDDLLLIFSSDHGEEFYDHGGYDHHRSVYEEVVHVPLILVSPRRIPAGVRIESVVRLVDVVPTILSLCGLPANGRLEGENLFSVAGDGPDPGDERVAFSETSYGHSTYSCSIRVGSHKLIYAKKALDEKMLLFDLSQDPKEQDDISGKSTGRTSSMRQQMASMRKHASTDALRAKDIRIDTDTKEKLRALGYAH